MSALSAQAPSPAAVGSLLRQWRQRRRMSQLALACEAEISTRHLSFVETGRSVPSREMLLQLAESLDVPLRERNTLLTAAGYAPVFRERPLDDPALSVARKAIDLVLAGHHPYPALAIDRHWNLIAHNESVPPLLAGVDPSLLAGPINVLRLSLHPLGLAPRIANLAQWRAHLLARLRRDVELSADPALVELLHELRGYEFAGHGDVAHGVDADADADADADVDADADADADASADTDSGVDVRRESAGVVVPFQLRTDVGLLSFVSTTTVFGTPLDVTLSEIALESFFPADQATADSLRRLQHG